MKKLMLILAALFIAAPVMAAVEFNGGDAGGKVMEIGYTTTDGDLPRGIALKVTITGDGSIDASGGMESAIVDVDAAFNCNIDFAYSNQGTYAVGDGHPLADSAAAGVLTDVDAALFSISAGVLDQTGNQGAGPATADPLIQIQLKGSGTVTVKVEADTYRGPDSGVVGSVLSSNLEAGGYIEFEVVLEEPDPCRDMLTQAGYESQLALYDEYLADVWTPADLACWCTAYQCDGDAAVDTHFLGYIVYTTDLNKMAGSWKAKMGDANLEPCADVMHDKHFLGYLVYTTDLNKLAANWKAKAADLAGNCPRDDASR